MISYENFIIQHDLIARAVSPWDYRLLIVKDQFKDKTIDFVANFLAEEDMLVQGMDMGPVYERFYVCKDKG
ncbi:MAG: hypothetical protein WAM28_02145 [Chlamydiales bacterium]